MGQRMQRALCSIRSSLQNRQRHKNIQKNLNFLYLYLLFLKILADQSKKLGASSIDAHAFQSELQEDRRQKEIQLKKYLNQNSHSYLKENKSYLCN